MAASTAWARKRLPTKLVFRPVSSWRNFCKPKAATHWSVRAIAKEPGIAKSTVHRLNQLFGLQPHRTRSFKLSTVPFFVEKLRDVVGLYLNPPDKAVVLASMRRAESRLSNAPRPCFPCW
jgi:hypothetical protein